MGEILHFAQNDSGGVGAMAVNVKPEHSVITSDRGGPAIITDRVGATAILNSEIL